MMKKSHSKHKEITEEVKQSSKNGGAIYLPAGLVYFAVSLLFLLVGLNGYLWAKLSNTNTTGTAAIPSAAAPAAAGQGQQPQQDLSKLTPVNDQDHIRGSKNADVVVVEYSDYECPYCKAFHPTMQQIIKDYGNKVAWVFRQYPLSFHPKAEKSAEATECAAEIGGNDAFWKLTDLIYEKMPDMELSQLPELAASVGVDKTKFSQCLDSGKYAQKIKDEENSGIQVGVQGTPGGVIVAKNGQKTFIPGALPYDQVKPMIDAALAGK
ncbi:MAG TPA: thioredoxin domain-containing protein [Patescibacteria group bacterium]